MFEHVDAYAGDPILTLNEAFGHDPRPHKINLSIGIYFDDAGRLFRTTRVSARLAGLGSRLASLLPAPGNGRRPAA